MKLHDEIFSLASEIVRRFPDKDRHECNVALQKAEFMNDEDFVYRLTETPHYLEKLGLAEILSNDLAFLPPNYWRLKSIRVTGDSSSFQSTAGRTLSFENSLKRKGENVPGFYAMSFDVQAIVYPRICSMV